jgi:hypothetical protein
MSALAIIPATNTVSSKKPRKRGPRTKKSQSSKKSETEKAIAREQTTENNKPKNTVNKKEEQKSDLIKKYRAQSELLAQYKVQTKEQLINKLKTLYALVPYMNEKINDQYNFLFCNKCSLFKIFSNDIYAQHLCDKEIKIINHADVLKYFSQQ